MKTVELDLLEAERLLKQPLKRNDLGKADFSEQFLEQLHDKIMASIENVEIQEKPSQMRALLPKRWRAFWQSSRAKTLSSLLTLFLFILTALHIVATSNFPKSKNQILKDPFLVEAINSPQEFEALVAGSLGQSDFLVDVASRNFDHLDLHDFDEILGNISSYGRAGSPSQISIR